jgi:hypothetical protein
MTEVSSESLSGFAPLNLSDVSPATVTSTSLLHGVIAIKWPYSSSSQKLTFLLADADPRKRALGGQIKVTLMGQAAEILDQIETGEEISVASTNIPTIEQDNSPRVKWHITFPQGCIIIVSHSKIYIIMKD